jgi:CheY-like chemotaxis protein
MNSLKKRILVVDDEPGVTRGLRRVLEQTGEYEVREENSAEHALMAAWKYQPDLILLDVMMPGIEGGELASEIRAVPKFREVPIVFLTALVAPGEVPGSGGPKGGEWCLAKPVDPADLIICLRKQLEKHSDNPVEAKVAEDTGTHITH